MIESVAIEPAPLRQVYGSQALAATIERLEKRVADYRTQTALAASTDYLGGRVTVAYEARITGAAKTFREKMFPGYVSDFLRTDPEVIERFDNFAFDEVIAQVNLGDETRYLGWLATLLGCQGIDEYRAMLPAALRCGNASWPRSATSRRKVVAARRQRLTSPPTSR